MASRPCRETDVPDDPYLMTGPTASSGDHADAGEDDTRPPERHGDRSVSASAAAPAGAPGGGTRFIAVVRDRLRGARTLSLGIWLLLLVGSGIVFFSRQRGDLVRLDDELRGASLSWLVPALMVELVLLGTMAWQQRMVYRLLGQRLPYWTLLSLLLRRMMIATLVPGGAPLSVAMQVRRLSDRGVPVGIALFGELFSGSIGTVSFVSVLIPVAMALVIGGSADIATVAATAILTMACVVIVTLFALALRRRGAPRWMTRWLPGRLRDGLEDARAQGVTFGNVVPAFIVALVVDFLGVLMLYLSIRAIHDQLSLLDVLVGYAVGSAFIFVTPVFGGFGVVELSMATALTARGLPPASALGGVLIYRSFELWLPLLLGIANEPLVRRGSTAMAGIGARTLPLRLPAIATGLTGLLSVLSTTRLHAPGTHHLHHHIAQHHSPGYWLFALPELSRSASLLAGVLLVALAWGLWRRKRAAWAMSLVMLVVAATDDIVRHHGTPVHLTDRRHARVVALAPRRLPRAHRCAHGPGRRCRRGRRAGVRLSLWHGRLLPARSARLRPGLRVAGTRLTRRCDSLPVLVSPTSSPTRDMRAGSWTRSRWSASSPSASPPSRSGARLSGGPGPFRPSVRRRGR